MSNIIKGNFGKSKEKAPLPSKADPDLINSTFLRSINDIIIDRLMRSKSADDNHLFIRANYVLDSVDPSSGEPHPLSPAGTHVVSYRGEFEGNSVGDAQLFETLLFGYGNEDVNSINRLPKRPSEKTIEDLGPVVSGIVRDIREEHPFADVDISTEYRFVIIQSLKHSNTWVRIRYSDLASKLDVGYE